MSETRAWQSLRQRLDDHEIHYQRFADRLTKGIPDTVILDPHTRRVAWIELKFKLSLGADQGRLGMRPGQAEWLNRWRRRGGVAGVLVRTAPTPREESWHYFPADANIWWVQAIQGPIPPKSAAWNQLCGWSCFGPIGVHHLLEAMGVRGPEMPPG